MGLLKFILVLMVIVYLFRFISPFIVKYLIYQLSKKMRHFDVNDSSSTSKKKPINSKKNSNKDIGEYIDYEEID